MSTKYRIAILGIGGVGGYVGGKLAGAYADSDKIEIIFVARGKTKEIIKSNGLKLSTQEEVVVVHPKIVSDLADELGQFDLVIICVKSYDLEASVLSIKPCLTEKSVLLPLQNGIDATQRLARLKLGADIWNGCIYLVSRIIEPGVVKQSGSLRQIYFGSASAGTAYVRDVERILTFAGLEAKMTESIERTLWEKFVFISAIATMTSYLNLSIGAILADEGHSKLLLELLAELKLVADAKGIVLDSKIVEKTFAKMQTLPYEATSSMHGDFQRGARTEIDSLTGYVVKLGRETGVMTPTHNRLLSELTARIVK